METPIPGKKDFPLLQPNFTSFKSLLNVFRFNPLQSSRMWKYQTSLVINHWPINLQQPVTNNGWNMPLTDFL